MKIYVAARFHEKERVKDIYKQLKQLGHTITEDWTNCTTQRPYSQHQDDARRCALHTIEGVKNCDVFIYLTNAEVGAGSSMEFGAALLSYHCFKTPRIYIVGPHLDTNFAFYHPDVIRKATIEEVLGELQMLQNTKASQQQEQSYV